MYHILPDVEGIDIAYYKRHSQENLGAVAIIHPPLPVYESNHHHYTVSLNFLGSVHWIRLF